MKQSTLMKFDPATGAEKPYPSEAEQWRKYHGATAWLFNPWTGVRRLAEDVGSDPKGLLISAQPISFFKHAPEAFFASAEKNMGKSNPFFVHPDNKNKQMVRFDGVVIEREGKNRFKVFFSYCGEKLMVIPNPFGGNVWDVGEFDSLNIIGIEGAMEVEVRLTT